MGTLTDIQIQAVISACLQLVPPDSKIDFVTKTDLFAKSQQKEARQNYNAKDQSGLLNQKKKYHQRTLQK